MLRGLVGLLSILCVIVSGCAHGAKSTSELKPGAKEKHFKSLKQLTFEGTNAEAYFSPDGKKLIYQGHTREQGCDQIFMMNTDGSGKETISHNKGRNTCSYFISDDRILFASTFKAGEECPKERDRSKGYVWEVFKTYEIFAAKKDGSDPQPLTQIEGYDAEATVCGGKIVFTSARQGNSLAIYTMNLDGSGVEKLTHEVGYNGGPFFSPDCSKIVYRAHHPKKKSDIKKFKKAVGEGYVPPGPLELYVMNADGSHKHKLTSMNAASFAPSFFPDGKKIIFSSNIGAKEKGRVFQLFSLPARARGAAEDQAEAITTEGTFNGFPMFSPDGKYLVFASNRNSSNPHELQVFIAEWQD